MMTTVLLVSTCVVLTLPIVQGRAAHNISTNKDSTTTIHGESVLNESSECHGIRCLSDTSYEYCKGTPQYGSIINSVVICRSGLVCTGDLKNPCGVNNRTTSASTVDLNGDPGYEMSTISTLVTDGNTGNETRTTSNTVTDGKTDQEISTISTLVTYGTIEYDESSECHGVKCLTNTTYRYCKITSHYQSTLDEVISCSSGLVCTGDLKDPCGADGSTTSASTLITDGNTELDETTHYHDHHFKHRQI